MSFTLTQPHYRESLPSNAVRIGLLNNLGDGGLEWGERQIVDLLASAARDHVVALSFYTLPSISRGTKAATHIARRYMPIDVLLRGDLDGLIVTGCEPRATTLPCEVFWRELTEVIDWAEHNTRSAIWSCLAAHAAVLHLDGLPRRRLQKKRSGIYEVSVVGSHALLEGISGRFLTPHSRWNELNENELASAGYQILTSGADVGIDTFAKQWRSLFVYLQGHPEYDTHALAREYQRDLHRFFADGLIGSYPTIPANYFDTRTEAALRAFEETAARGRTKSAALPALSPKPMPTRDSVRKIFRNWLEFLALQPHLQGRPQSLMLKKGCDDDNRADYR